MISLKTIIEYLDWKGKQEMSRQCRALGIGEGSGNKMQL